MMKHNDLLDSNKICPTAVTFHETIQTGKEWAKPVVALLPPGGGDRSRNRKEFPAGAVSGS